ncbi:MAG: M20/M25/M40 family metallo-hydrolase [Candidatus Binatia bacterium]
MENQAGRKAALSWSSIRLAVVIGVVCAGPAFGFAISDSRIEELLGHVRYLASDELMGRGVGTPGIDMARDYIAGEFKKYGLAPGGGPGGYFQRLSVPTGVRVVEPSSFIARGSRQLKTQEEWIPLGLSGSGKITGEVVFVGYGVTAKDYGYDDYAGLDVKGKVVLVLRYEPPPKDDKSPFRKAPRYSRHATFNAKIDNARSHGAAGMILVDLSSSRQNELVPLRRSLGRAETSFVAVQVKKQIAEQWFPDRGLSLEELKQKIDGEEQPASTPLAGSHVAVQVTLEKISAPAENVVGFLPASDANRASESVIIGAHYDHLGLGSFGTLDDSQEGKIHNGADDNASGVAVLLQVARRLSERPQRLKRNVVFVAFTGEELGLHGARHYVNHPPFPIDAAKTMINLDMVGRMRKNGLTVFGLETAQEFRSLVNEAAQGLGLEVVTGSGRAMGRSDHAPFYGKSIPVLHLFTGNHEDYHRPSDDWEKLNIEGMEKVSVLLTALVEKIAQREEPLTFARPPQTPGKPADSETRYGAYLGTLPDFTELEGGVRLAGIQEGSPAQIAGLKEGDVIVQLAGTKVENLEDLAVALRSRKPGDQVDIVVLRRGNPLTFKAVLGRRA